MQVNDTRKELQTNLALWKDRMLNKIERIYEKLLGKYSFEIVFINLIFIFR
jgi:hypothetical protein